MHVILGEQSYLDDGNLDSRELFRFADSTGVLPKSAAINAFEFETIFRRLLDEDYDIFFLGISSRLSSTMQNAVTAANNIGAGERISIVDSLSLSTGVFRCWQRRIWHWQALAYGDHQTCEHPRQGAGELCGGHAEISLHGRALLEAGVHRG